MITELTVRGYRSLRDVTWRPGRLNVLIGPNASGKSNLLRAIRILNSATREKFRDTIFAEGGLQAISWDSTVNDVHFQLAADLDVEEKMKRLEYALSLKPIGLSGGFRISRETLDSSAWMQTDKRQPPLKAIERNENEARVYDARKRLIELEKGPLGYGVDQPILSISSITNPSITQLRNYLVSAWISTDFSIGAKSAIRAAVVARMEKDIEIDGGNLVPFLHTLYTTDRRFKDDVDSAIYAAFSGEYEALLFPPAANQRIQLCLRWRSLNSVQPAANLSDGTLRFLMLVAILANPEPPSLIAIDEPETGLHPSMFPIIAELAQEAAERTQVVFSTHSPEFLDAFRKEAPTTTIFHAENGETRIANVDGDELNRWLKEYSLGSMFRSGELESMI